MDMKSKITEVVSKWRHASNAELISELVAALCPKPENDLCLPWGVTSGLVIRDADGREVCDVSAAYDRVTRHDFILCACNNHHDLVKIAKAARLYHGPKDLLLERACDRVGIAIAGDANADDAFAAHIASVLESCGEVLP